MNIQKYRLNRYIITEYEGNVFTWETHIALGSQLSGNCFIIGDILVLGPREHEDSGFLILEFHEHLRKLRAWDQTRYYCPSSSLQDIESGQNLCRHFNPQRLKTADNVQSPGVFRLGKYKIEVGQNGNISWHAYEGVNQIISGKCMIESGILFIGNRESERCDSRKKKEWFKALSAFPKWDKTFAWGHSRVLQDCRHKEIKRRSIWDYADGKDRIKSKDQLSSREKDHPDQQIDPLPDLGSIWRRFRDWEGWRNWVLPFLIKSLSAFLFVLWFVIEKSLKLFGKMMRWKMNKSLKILLLSFALMTPTGSMNMAVADDHGTDRHSHEMDFEHDDEHNKGEEGHQERHKHHGDGDDEEKGEDKLKAVDNPVYKENCGACHLAYQPELLPSASWMEIMSSLDGHFGETVELGDDSKKIISEYLKANSAENSSAEEAAKIMRSLGGRTPMRITDIPYIQEKHHDISQSRISNQAVGSLSNCSACHQTAENGNYDDDNVTVPR